MRSQLRYLCLLTALTVGPCLAQTPGDLGSKYGEPIQSYEIRPGIFATFRYAADNQACEMRVEKRHVRTSGTINVDETLLSAEESGWIVDEVAPATIRGKRDEDFPRSLITIVGGGVTKTDVYENVSITSYSKYTQGKKGVISGPVAIVITWKNRPCKQG